MIKFNDKTLERFSRQIIIDKVGIKGQKKIVNTSLAIIGCGGLGTSAAQYLTMAGIGGVFLADDDIVSLSNLNRQTLFLESDLKKNKAETLAKKLIQINPKLNINILPKKISKKNISKFLKNYSILLDCSDNFETRYLLNKYSFQKKKILISAGLENFDVQLFSFSSWKNKNYPCYECIFPKNQKNKSLDCDQLGIISPVAGMGGVLQAMTVLNIILKLDQKIFKEIILYDCLGRIFKKINVEKNPTCKICKI